MKYDLKPLWQELMLIYAEIERICRKHGLRCYVAYGGLLGAVRHKGYIPWDDDLDLAMPRPDYERFMEICKSELSDRYCWDSIEVNEAYLQTMGKVRLCANCRDVFERVARESNLKLKEGIFVDVFPFDGRPGGWFGLKYFVIRRAVLRRLHDWSCAHGLRQSLSRLFGFVGVAYHDACRYNDLMRKWPFEKCEWVGWVDSGTRRNNGGAVMRAWFGETVRLPFMDTTIAAPVGYDEMLRVWYGNYMQLPPVEARVPGHQDGSDETA